MKTNRRNLTLTASTALSAALLAAVLLPGCSPATPASDFPPPPAALDSAPDYLRTPLLRFDDAARRPASSPEARFDLARAYHANGFLDEAEAVYRLLATPDAEEARPFHLLACLLVDRGRPAEAVPFFREATNRDPNYGPAWLKLGDALLKSGHHSEAFGAVLRSLDAGISAAHAHLGLARIALALRDDEAAGLHLEASIEADPLATAAHHLLAAIRRRQGRDDEAAAHRRAAAGFSRHQEAPDPWLDALENLIFDPDRLAVLADTAQQVGAIERARALCRRALDLHPNHLRSRLLLAEIHLGLDQSRASLEQAREAVRIDPGSAAARQALGLALRATGQPREALGEFREAIRLTPGYALAHAALAETLHELGRSEEAERAYRDALAQNPHATATLTNLGALLASREHFQEALHLFEQTLALAPGEPRASHYAAVIHVQADRLTEAESLLRKSRSLHGGTPDTTDLLARVLTARGNGLLQQDRSAEARTAFEEALPLAREAGNLPLAAAIESFLNP